MPEVTDPQTAPDVERTESRSIVVMGATFFAVIVVLFFAWLTLIIQDSLDPCVNDGCGGVVKAVFVTAAAIQVALLALVVRFAWSSTSSLVTRVGSLVGAAVAAPVLMVVGAYVGTVLS